MLVRSAYQKTIDLALVLICIKGPSLHSESATTSFTRGISIVHTSGDNAATELFSPTPTLTLTLTPTLHLYHPVSLHRLRQQFGEICQYLLGILLAE